jgi:membrane protease YdiL (CAAX protease family)
MAKNRNRQNEGFLNSLIKEKTPAKTAGLTYTVAAVVYFGAVFALSLVLGFLLLSADETPDWFLYVNYLIAPVVFVIVGAWYFSYTKTPVKTFIKEQNCSYKSYLVAVALQIGLFSLGELNGLFLEFLKKFGYTDAGIDLPSMEGVGFIGVFFTIAVLPAIMEEFLFRGVFLHETRELPILARVLICGGLFALYHQNPAQTIYQFICGGAFALVAIKSGSFLPTALSHFINNTVILLFTKFGVDTFSPTVYVLLLAVSGICLVGSLAYLLVFDRGEREEKKGSYRQFFACAALGIVMLSLSWFAMLVTGM